MLRARQKLGKYRIERRLSNGPIAAVYQAFDTISGVRVALKVPHPGAMDEFFLADFRREARLAPQLEHANILPIRDASFIDGHFVISMPLGERSLADRMRKRIATRTAMGLADQAMTAVAHAHSKRVIHCDIKPDNFILFPGNQLRLTDFGFSKIALRTVKASGSGTIGYLAPEQALGRPMFQSDVFSLGLVIYQLFSGQLPGWPYTWPPQGYQRLRAKVKPPMVGWLRRALEFRPQDRFANAQSMQREFRRVRNGAAKRLRPRRELNNSASDDWQAVRFRQFQRKYKSSLETRYECHRCEGPVGEAMQACPWCGCQDPMASHDTAFPAHCPRCRRGVKLDWHYCPWCYGPGFEIETNRHYSDRRYTERCANRDCRGLLMPFMRYCPWCRSKVKKPWKQTGSSQKCPRCQWWVAHDFWGYCPWCSKALPE